MKRHNILIILFVGFLIFAFFWQVLIRLYLLKNNISTFYLAETLPNFLAVVLFTFGAMTLLRYKENSKLFKLSTEFTASMVAYEFLQLIIPGRTFDVNDIIASVIGGVFSYIVLILINKIFTSNNMSIPRRKLVL